MRFRELIEKRYSVRAYKTDPVSDEQLAQLLEAARLAPTAANRQPFQLIVIRTAGREAELKRIYPKDWFAQAPLVIGVCAVPERAWIRHDSRNYGDIDATIVMDHIILAATDLGLGTCWIGAFDVPAAREVLGLPAEVEPIAFTPVGYAADAPHPKKRGALSDLVRREKW
jgi:nitroreductase